MSASANTPVQMEETLRDGCVAEERTAISSGEVGTARVLPPMMIVSAPIAKGCRLQAGAEADGTGPPSSDST